MGGRLVTLTGPGGVGKTRLALQVAAELGELFPAGVFVTSLAAITEPGLIAAAIAVTLGVSEAGGGPALESLKAYVRATPLLLVLDNFEQVLAAAPLVAELLECGPELKVLVTSRAPLRLRGEQEFRVPPLRVPPPVSGASLGGGDSDIGRFPGSPTDHYQPSDLTEYAAVKLFVHRARDAEPDFSLTVETAPAVAEICRRLDGLPLAIELAVARLKLFSPQELLARLESQLALLTGGARDLPSRQQSLRGEISWSYELLSEPAKTLFRRLAVFAGGCDLDAIETVCGNLEFLLSDAGSAAEPGATQKRKVTTGDACAAEGVSALLDWSLLRREAGPAGDPRFGMLETIREYASECLATSGEEEALRRRHAAYYLALAEAVEPKLHGAEERVWLDRLEQEQGNLRAALHWLIQRGETQEALRLGGALRYFWHIKNRWEEGRDCLARLLALPGAEARTAARAAVLLAASAQIPIRPESERRLLLEEALSISRELSDKRRIASALLELGSLAHNADDDLEEAMAFLRESLNLWQELSDKTGIAETLGSLARKIWLQGDHATAHSLVQRELTIWQDLGSERGLAWSFSELGHIARVQGDYAAARTWYEKALASRRRIGTKRAITESLYALADVAWCQADYATARSLYEEFIATDRESVGFRVNRDMLLFCLGGVMLCQGECEAAAELFAERLALRRNGAADAEAEWYVHLHLVAMAEAASRQGRWERAARLFGAAGPLRELYRLPPPADRPIYLPYPAIHADVDQCLSAVRAALDDRGFSAAYAEGQAMTLAEAVAEALSEPETSADR
jgi:predicted ATPase